MESRSTAICRYAGVAQAIADTARKLVECRGSHGEELKDCTPVPWASDTRTLALSLLTVALHESGLREDVQLGVGPMGRGPSGAVCLVQVLPRDALGHAPWLSNEDREAIRGREGVEAFAQTLLGTSPESLARCVETGGRMLVRARKSCERARVPWDFGMFSMYGSGSQCSVPHVATRRKRTLRELMGARPVLTPEDAAALDRCAPP